MSNKKKIVIGVAILILLVTIGGVIYYTIYKNVTDRETFDGKTENLGNIPVDTTNNIFDLYNSKTEYIGNNSNVSKLLERLEIYELGNYTIELKTDKEPYALIIRFNDIRLDEKKVNEKMNMYSKILLALINNVGEIHWKINDVEKGIVTVSNIDIDNIKNYGKSSEKLHSLLINIGYYQ